MDSPDPDLAPEMIRMESAHVRYRVFEQRRPTLGEIAKRGVKIRSYREVHALRGVDLSVRAGEILGVIGTNGSGKSTMLRAAAGLLPVTSGAVFARGRPALLGVATALKPRLSGRNNVIIGCLALGMTREQIDDRFDDIVGWAELQDFIDMPMSAYSSGMKGRLQFSIATAATPDILLVDEALSVGDRRFRRRSRKRMLEMSEHAGTILIVTHAMKQIRNLCTRVVWLDRGTLMMDGEPDEVVDAYEKANTDAGDDPGDDDEDDD